MEYSRSDLMDGMTKYQIPEQMRPGLLHWIEDGTPPGHFLSAVLRNDLYQAFTRADDDNVFRIQSYIKFLYNHAPGNCWGSVAHFEDWKKYHGLKETRIVILDEDEVEEGE